MYNIRVVARKAKIVENHAPRSAWFLPGFACLRIKACGCELAFGENHAPFGAWFLVYRPFKCAWFSH